MSYSFKAAFAGLRRSRNQQQRNPVALLLFSILCCVLFLPPSHLPVANAGEARAMGRDEHVSHGKLIVVSPNSNIVIVDADQSGRQRIVGGKVAPDAILVKDGKKVNLKAFRVGDYVKILWRYTSIGKQIVSLATTDERPAPRPAPVKSNGIIQPSQTQASYNGSGLYTSQIRPIIGYKVSHVVGPKETLLKIARKYSLGYNEIIDLYPQYDPWLPPVGQRLALPTERILPDARQQGIVINIAELRLYYYHKRNGIPMVTTYPVSIGTPSHQTPLGRYHIASKTVDPTWTVPSSLRHKYSFRSVPPGPDNPLGKYWLGLSIRAYGIHGTDIAWSVGRTITQGCIRMYPEDIERFFGVIKMGTKVNLVYQPIKAARDGNKIYIEIHKDVYQKHLSLGSLARRALSDKDLWPLVDRHKLAIALRDQSGVPVDITDDSLQARR
ncbi:L,D-transpeptidase family protein [Desulfosediminicola ganghwensis]|uniref:L,D-transpeptidase family protein n=1 Tax=Desulfosediminicola ganghwensis TaxID=2569540 RepID=UPI0010AB7E19|nr:L,D-transpeptidase family protein [Desulfosediminicola ganghwensis]